MTHEKVKPLKWILLCTFLILVFFAAGHVLKLFQDQSFTVGFRNNIDQEAFIVVQVYNEQGDLLETANIQSKPSEAAETLWSTYPHSFEELSFTAEAYSLEENGDAHLIDKIFGQWPGNGSSSCGNGTNSICIEFSLEESDDQEVYLEFGGVL